MKLHRSFVFMAILGFTACRTKSQNDSEVQSEVSAESRQPKAVFDVWQAHIREETGGKKIQPDCMPKHFGPKEGVSSRGLVVIYHGFTACPQQFFLIGQKLADKGFDVFLPLMPGQGRQPFDEEDKNGLKKDNHFDLPTDKDVHRYKHLVDQMVDLARKGVGIKVVGGLSGGGGLSFATAVEGKDVWARAFFMAPFFKFPHVLGPTTAIMDLIYPGFTTHYDKQCKLDRGFAGKRNGLCAVSVDAMRAMRDFGDSYTERAHEIPVRAMFVGAEADPTVDNGAIFRTFQKTKDARICFYKKGVPHSMVSRLENLHLDHKWNNSLEIDTVNFVADGTWFPTEGEGSSFEYKQRLCLVDD